MAGQNVLVVMAQVGQAIIAKTVARAAIEKTAAQAPIADQATTVKTVAQVDQAAIGEVEEATVQAI